MLGEQIEIALTRVWSGKAFPEELISKLRVMGERTCQALSRHILGPIHVGHHKCFIMLELGMQSESRTEPEQVDRIMKVLVRHV